MQMGCASVSNRRGNLTRFLAVRLARRLIVVRLARTLIKDESGQGTVEYLLILSVTIGFSIGMAKIALAALDTGILKFGAQLEKDLRTGRMPPSVYKN